MAKKRKKSSIAKKLATEAGIIRILTEIAHDFSAKLVEDHLSELIQDDDGQVVLRPEGIPARYTFADDTSDIAKGYLLGAGFAQSLLSSRNRKEFLPNAMSFLVGLGSGFMLAVEELEDLKGKIAKLTEHRAKGGRATKRLSSEQEKIAIAYIEEELRPGVSRTAACTRAAAKLYRDFDIQVSGKTLMALAPGNR